MRQLRLRPLCRRITVSVLAAILPAVMTTASESASQASVRIEPELEASMRLRGETAVLIDFRERPDLSPALTMGWEARGQFVVAELRAAAERSQSRVRAYLDAEGLAHRSFWIDNLIYVPSASRRVLDDLVTFEEIEVLRADRTMSVIEPDDRAEAPERGRSIEPNISHVKADQVWGLGITGTGMVVGSIDTGVRYTHEVLQPHYRGNLGGGVFDHDYNWLSGDGGSATPVDGHGHGSHTTGTMVGDDGGANQVGMAPGATWIACEGCPNGDCSFTALLTCAQWVAAPYPVGDPSSPDPSKRPHVVNNSWGDCAQSYGSWTAGTPPASTRSSPTSTPATAATPTLRVATPWATRAATATSPGSVRLASPTAPMRPIRTGARPTTPTR